MGADKNTEKNILEIANLITEEEDKFEELEEKEEIENESEDENEIEDEGE